MKLTNSTDWPDQFIRRMVSWCCREVGYPVRRLRKAEFRNSTYKAFAGLGGCREIFVRIGPAERFPVNEYDRHGVSHCGFADRLEALVGVTAHEVYHCWQTANRKMKGARHDEPAAMNAERSAIRAFAADREQLISEWSAERELVAAESAPRLSVIDKRAAKAAADLKRWRAKLKLAQAKVKKLTRRVAYYDRRATA